MDGDDTIMEAGNLATLAARRPISKGGVQQVSGFPWNCQHGEQAAITRSVPEEMPVAIMAGSRPAAVVIASPADYADLGWGFVITEGIAQRAADIVDCTVTEVDDGIRVVVQLAQQRFARERVLPGRSSCGLCGISDLKQAVARFHGSLQAVV